MDLTDASTLTATAFADAIDAVGGSIAWASPTALRAVVSTGDDLSDAARTTLDGLRLLLVAGAPVPVSLLDGAALLLPSASLATPYGMTEALPLTEVTLDELRSERGNGVLVGRPLPGVDVTIAPLDVRGVPATVTGDHPGVTGEIVVRSAWMRERYDRRWATQHRADSPRGWHRTGDVGQLDEAGRLWVEGRLAHVIVGPQGPITPVAGELAAQRAANVPLAALVGVGPAGAQVVAAVLLMPGPVLGLADVDLTMVVREAIHAETGQSVAAVLTMRSLPVDVRHRSKVDRIRIAREVSALLGGEDHDG